MHKVGPGLTAGLIVAGVHNAAHADEDLILGEEGTDDFGDCQGTIREEAAAQTPRFVRFFTCALGGSVGGHDAGEFEFLRDGDQVGQITVLGVGGDFQEERLGVLGGAVEFLEGGKESPEVVRLGEIAEAGGVGGADVDDEKVAEGVENLQ